jgi:hypothetical protein
MAMEIVEGTSERRKSYQTIQLLDIDLHPLTNIM